MLNSLGLPEDVIRGYLLSHQIITQEQHDKINLETEQFDEVDETDTAKDE
jgi:hypothetical protein